MKSSIFFNRRRPGLALGTMVGINWLSMAIHCLGATVNIVQNEHVPQFSMTKTYYEILGVDPNADSRPFSKPIFERASSIILTKNPDSEESRPLHRSWTSVRKLSDPALRAEIRS
jgi:hypothetical protein